MSKRLVIKLRSTTQLEMLCDQAADRIEELEEDKELLLKAINEWWVDGDNEKLHKTAYRIILGNE